MLQHAVRLLPPASVMLSSCCWGPLQQGQSYVERQDDKTVKEWMRQQVRN